MIGKIIEIEGFKAIGISYFGDNKNEEIKDLWAAFNNNWKQIPDKDPSQLCYGVCEAMNEKGEFKYTACSKVTSLDNLPAGMEGKVVPAGKYAVYTFSESLDKLGDFYNNLFTKTIVEDALTFDNRPELEVYDHRFLENGVFDIYVPIK